MSNRNLKNVGSSPTMKRREPKPYWDKKWLLREYAKKKRSAYDISVECGGSEGNVLYFLSKHSIPRRSTAEVRKHKKWGSPGSSNPMYGRCGDKNPRWIDGSSPERNRMYARSFWKELARIVYERDRYKCVRCGCGHEKGSKLHAHHVKAWAGNKKKRFDVDNIITLCRECHNWVHSIKNRDNEHLSP